MTTPDATDRCYPTDRKCPSLRRRWFAGLLGMAVGFSVSARLAVAEPVFTNKERFRIPYQLDAAEIKRLGATEIQLHVSTDHGRSWRHVDSVPPVEGKFTFEAAGDGDYAFAVRTVDRQGNLHPPGPLMVSLEVTVDTTPPELDIDVSQVEPGRVRVQWKATDAHLQSDTLALEHRVASSGDWQPMSIEVTSSGQTNWSVIDGGTIEVRGTIRDAAGNETHTVASGTIEKAAPDVASPVAEPQPRERRQPIAAIETEPTPTDIIEPEAPESTDSAEPDALSAEEPDEAESSSLVKADAPRASDRDLLPTIHPEKFTFSPVSSAPDEKPAVTQPRWDREPEQAPKPEPAPKTESDRSTSDSRAQVALRTEKPPAPSSPLDEGAVRRVSSSTFQIAYRVDDVGPSGVGSVDLYLTENGGDKWYHYGADQDRRSPFQVTVPGDGTYGFAIRVKSGVGLSAIPPQPGDAPELTIIVDRQPPQASLLPVRPGNDAKSPQLIIEWKVTDEALPDKPIALSYAENPSGPWQSLSDWQANSGQYVWNVGPNVPPQVYLRLEARDAAGNTARVTTEEPVTIDLSKPTARFLNVETVE